jgi:hypothetical protein
MLTGWDHLLFIAGVVLFARRARRALTLLSLFSLGHCTTLIIATLAGFGLIHGLGLATRFQQVTVQADGLFSRLIAFNVGVELAQLAVVYLLYLLGETVVRDRRWPQIERVAFGGLVAVGLASGVMLSLART